MGILYLIYIKKCNWAVLWLENTWQTTFVEMLFCGCEVLNPAKSDVVDLLQKSAAYHDVSSLSGLDLACRPSVLRVAQQVQCLYEPSVSPDFA
jgi:hypothetical protein